MSECLTCETAFCKKAQNFVWFGSSDFDQTSPACGKHSYKWNVWLLQLSIAMETWKSLNAKLSVKSWCFERVFHVAVANANIGSQKCHL